MAALALLLALALADAPDAGTSESMIPLRVGTQRVVDFTGFTGIAVGAPSVLDVRPLGATQLLLVGLARGESGLLLFRPDGTYSELHVRVRSGDPDGDWGQQELRETARESPRLTLTFVGDRVFVEGYLGSEEDFFRLRSAYPSILIFAEFDPELIKRRVDAINDALVRAGYLRARAVPQGELLLIEGEVADETERHKAELIAQALWLPLAQAMDALREHKQGARAAP